MFIWIRWLAEVTWAGVALAEPCCSASWAWRFLGQRLDRVKKKKEVGEPLNLAVGCKRGWLRCLIRGLTFGQSGGRRSVAADIWTTIPSSTSPHKLQIHRFQHIFWLWMSMHVHTVAFFIYTWCGRKKHWSQKIRICFYDLLIWGYVLLILFPQFS